MNRAVHRRTRRDAAERGYTLIEIMIALSVGLFLVGGLLLVLQENRRTFGGQNALAQLQDGQRLAMTMIADVIQSAGYFPDPTTSTQTTALPSNVQFATAGQSIVGTENAAAPGDTVTVRYVTASGDGVLNCSGTSNSSGAVQTYVNTFSVAGGQVVCAMNGTNYVLISGVTNLNVLYGVKTNFAIDNNNVDTYLNANQMTAANWGNVISVNVSLTFTNPLYAAGTAQPQTILISRVIDLMNRIGVKI